MLPVVAAILEGMPDPRDLRRLSLDGETLIFAGSRLLFRHRDGDAGAGTWRWRCCGSWAIAGRRWRS